MATSKIKELRALQARAAALQIAIDAERNKDLNSLPSRYGFDSVEAFIQAVRNASSAKSTARGAKKKVASKSIAKTVGSAGKRKRAKITPAIKAKVKAAVKAGTSGAEIARTVGISLPSVHNIKKELGLVKERK
jgi:hypothetical protein